jgi:hypothetical protein
MATAVRRGNTDGIAQCGMTRATLEATGCRHWGTTRSVSPQRPPGQHANKQQSTNTPTKLAVLMAIAMRRYDTARIGRWRGSRASLKANGCHHRASNCSDSMQSDIPTPVLSDVFHRQIVSHKTTRIAPNNNRGMTYQNDEKHLISIREYFVGGVSIAFNRLNNRFLLRVINQ